MKLVPAVADHIREVKLDGLSIDEQAMALDMVVAMPHINDLLNEYARTLLVGDDDRVLATFGIWPMWAGVGRAWSLITTEAMRRYPKSLFKAVSRCLFAIEERDQIRRTEATVRFGHTAAHVWIRHLGFRNPARMRNYGIGGFGDYYLYERIQSWPDSA